MRNQSQISTINFEHLRYAVVAADKGSFRQAAETLLVKQSTLSRCIRQLEDSIGIAVFNRSRGGITATPSGRRFLRQVRSILEQIDSLVTSAHRASRGEIGQLSIGFYTSLSAGTLRATLQDFRQRFPNVQLGMVERPQTRLMAELRSGALEVAVVTSESTRGDSGTLMLWSERILLALPERHSLADRDTIFWTDLIGETVLLTQCDRGRELEGLLISKFGSSKDRPRIEHHDVSRSIIKSLVGVMNAVSLVLESDIGAKISGLVYREIRDSDGPSRIGYSAHWRQDNDNPALVSFLRLLRERYPSPAA